MTVTVIVVLGIIIWYLAARHEKAEEKIEELEERVEDLESNEHSDAEDQDVEKAIFRWTESDDEVPLWIYHFLKAHPGSTTRAVEHTASQDAKFPKDRGPLHSVRLTLARMKDVGLAGNYPHGSVDSPEDPDRWWVNPKWHSKAADEIDE